MANKAGITPLAMAAINGQSETVKEFFKNSAAKSDIDLGQIVMAESKQILLALIVLYCPMVHPDLVLQRAEVTEKLANAVDKKGNTLVMELANRNSRETLRRVLICKASTQKQLFNMNIKNMYDKNILHLLVRNNDVQSVRMVLNLQKDCSEILNNKDCSGSTPLMLAYDNSCFEVADVIVNHPRQKSRIDWSLKNSKNITLNSLSEDAKQRKLEVKETKISIVTVKRQSAKQNFLKRTNAESDVKENPAKVVKTGQLGNKNKTNGAVHQSDIVMDDLSEEKSFIEQVKRQQEEETKRLEEKRKLQEKKEAEERSQSGLESRPKRLTQEDKMRALKEKMEQDKNKVNGAEVSQADQLLNIAECMEKKRLRRLAAKSKMSEKERQEQEDKAVQQAMYEEIIWALKQKKEIAEEAGLQDEVDMYNRRLKEEQENMDGTTERKRRQVIKEREDRENQIKLAAENEKLAREQAIKDAVQREIDAKAKKEREARQLEEQKKMDIERKKRQEEEAFERLPKWKKEKILKAKAQAEEVILKARLAEEERILEAERRIQEAVEEEERKRQEVINQALEEAKRIEDEKIKREEEKKRLEEEKIRDKEKAIQVEAAKVALAEAQERERKASEREKERKIQVLCNFIQIVFVNVILCHIGKFILLT